MRKPGLNYQQCSESESAGYGLTGRQTDLLTGYLCSSIDVYASKKAMQSTEVMIIMSEQLVVMIGILFFLGRNISSDNSTHPATFTLGVLVKKEQSTIWTTWRERPKCFALACQLQLHACTLYKLPRAGCV